MKEVLGEATRTTTGDIEFERDVVIRSILYENPDDEALVVKLHSGLDSSPVGAAPKLINIANASGDLDGARASGQVCQHIGRGKIEVTSIGANAKVTVLFSPASVGA